MTFFEINRKIRYTANRKDIKTHVKEINNTRNGKGLISISENIISNFAASEYLQNNI